MFTKEEIKLAPKVYEAIKRISAKTEKYPCLTKDQDGTKQLTYKEWKPEEGDWGLTDYGEVVLIYRNTEEKSQRNCPLLANTEVYGITACIGPGYHEVGIPFLRWEEIERILGELGFATPFDFHVTFENKFLLLLSDADGIPKAEGIGKTRQEAVQKAVIKLGEKC